jgi:chromosomal replication initiator protein
MSSDHQEVWGNCLINIRDVVGDQAFNTWFDPIIPLKLEDKILTIQVPSQFFYEWLEEHYVHILRDVIYQQLGNDGKLEYSIVIDRGNSNSKPYTINIPTTKRADPKLKPEDHNGKENDIRDIFKYDFQLNRNYTFDTFIEGDCNRLARSAGYAVAQRPGITSFNPLMVYGGVGLGKTHLAQAIGNEIMQNIAGKSVIYVPAEKFTQQFIESVKINKIQEFQNFYNKIDILILDDVQFLSGREKTQEIFFHIFNHLHQLGKQIIMTSDCPPKDLKGLEERLLSRFKWGLTADLQQPDFETRIAIIQKKLQADGINFPENVLEYLAYSVDTNIRELEGVLISLIAHASLMKKDIDLELAKQTLKTIIHDIDTEVSIDYIQKTVAEYFHLKTEDLKDKTRKKEVVIARQLAMYFSKEYTNHSLKSIGYHFGGRDHSTVIHAVQTVNDMYDVDSRFRSSVDELKKKLKMKSI